MAVKPSVIVSWIPGAESAAGDRPAAAVTQADQANGMVITCNWSYRKGCAPMHRTSAGLRHRDTRRHPVGRPARRRQSARRSTPRSRPAARPRSSASVVATACPNHSRLLSSFGVYPAPSSAPSVRRTPRRRTPAQGARRRRSPDDRRERGSRTSASPSGRARRTRSQTSADPPSLPGCRHHLADHPSMRSAASRTGLPVVR